MNIQVPGLDKWSLPLLRNEKVPDDPPLEETELDAETEDNESAPLRATA